LSGAVHTPYKAENSVPSLEGQAVASSSSTRAIGAPAAAAGTSPIVHVQNASGVATGIAFWSGRSMKTKVEISDQVLDFVRPHAPDPFGQPDTLVREHPTWV
jgi:predicted aconitase